MWPTACWGFFFCSWAPHMWDCPRDSRVSLGFALAGRPGADWDAVHRLTGGVWLAAGLAAIAGTMEGASWVAAAAWR